MPRDDLVAPALFAAAAGFALATLLCSGRRATASDTMVEGFPDHKRSKVEKVVHAFLRAQSERDLEKMCELFAEDGIYVNDPFPTSRHIKGRAMFRKAFESSPCVWCKDARLRVLRSCYDGGDTVWVEREDAFKIDGVWLRIPIMGRLTVKGNKIVFWKDFFDYAKYKAFVVEHWGVDFKLFRDV